MNPRDDRSAPRNRSRGSIRPPARRSAAGQSSHGLLSSVPKRQSKTSHNPSSVRNDFGFDDIPVEDDDLDDVRLRDILRSWAKQAIKGSVLEKKLLSTKLVLRRLRAMKNDLKWALMADMDDENRPPKVNRKPRESHRSAPQPPHATSSRKSVEININFGSAPTLPRLFKRLSFRKLRLSQRRLIVTILASSVILGGLSWYIIPKLPGATQIRPNTVVSTEIEQSPNYPTLLPEDKTIEALGGWHRISPPERNPVFAYADKIKDVSINVSQQPIPEAFKANIDESVAELAKSYAATDKVATDSLTFYIGTSIRGPQSVIMAKGSVLILMKSTDKIDKDAWVAYIQSLSRENIPSTTF